MQSEKTVFANKLQLKQLMKRNLKKIQDPNSCFHESCTTNNSFANRITMHLLTTLDPYVMDERKKNHEEHILLATVEAMLQHMIDIVRILQAIEITPCGDTTWVINKHGSQQNG